MSTEQVQLNWAKQRKIWTNGNQEIHTHTLTQQVNSSKPLIVHMLCAGCVLLLSTLLTFITT